MKKVTKISSVNSKDSNSNEDLTILDLENILHLDLPSLVEEELMSPSQWEEWFAQLDNVILNVYSDLKVSRAFKSLKRKRWIGEICYKFHLKKLAFKIINSTDNNLKIINSALKEVFLRLHKLDDKSLEEYNKNYKWNCVEAIDYKHSIDPQKLASNLEALASNLEALNLSLKQIV